MSLEKRELKIQKMKVRSMISLWRTMETGMEE